MKIVFLKIFVIFFCISNVMTLSLLNNRRELEDSGIVSKKSIKAKYHPKNVKASDYKSFNLAKESERFLKKKAAAEKIERQKHIPPADDLTVKKAPKESPKGKKGKRGRRGKTAKTAKSGNSGKSQKRHTKH